MRTIDCFDQSDGLTTLRGMLRIQFISNFEVPISKNIFLYTRYSLNFLEWNLTPKSENTASLNWSEISRDICSTL